ncbi:uracil phosphoribosyltransferase [Cyclonatronum proteinivorum]|uniref:Uracil phosphoribosyltransferase n=1 Tax=Cyclonatronum proteinivorum TaxID=1457365 RepID=A0A345UKF0_9BACT|nr:uracil phosphoribosyltransferase [Cyclonatronum proteinivorum]AXJ00952.1 uracil phosphoribosyltransferase [Cyclonatronum proteinivorum]
MNPAANFTEIKHPVIARDLTILRNKKTDTANFRLALSRISTILAYHALNNISLESFEVETPIQTTTGYKLGTNIVVIPILRAGLGLVDAITTFVPDARVGHLGMYRDEVTKKPVDYYVNVPDGIENALVLVVDPMLATGGSACDAISFLKSKGAREIRFICLIAAPEGVEAVQKQFPEVAVITAALDERLNENKFIVPGLGDAGDRIFGTT